MVIEHLEFAVDYFFFGDVEVAPINHPFAA
jgi:hypothetical protein